MKSVFAAALLLIFSITAFAQETSELTTPPNGDNEHAEVSQWIGPVRISIDYHSPRVHNPAENDRTGHIWGELVHYGIVDEGFGPTKGAPWRAGANESTTITFSNDVKVEAKDLQAGTYALFLDVKKEGSWNWILSKHLGWGSFQYDPKYDVLHVAVTPADAPFTEFMTYGFDERHPDSAVAYLQWEKKRVPLKIEVPNVNALYVAKMRQDLESWAGFNYQDWQTAAQFCADNKINLEEALEWADKAVNGPFRGATIAHEDFSTLSTKAAVLVAMGRDADADAVIQKALHLPTADSYSIYAYAMGLLRTGRKDDAMKIFSFNHQQHPQDKFWGPLGLARGYTALGDKKNAVANWEIVVQNVPANLSGRIPMYEAALKKAKLGGGGGFRLQPTAALITLTRSTTPTASMNTSPNP
jgi:tetratricopeptide (TPR) repeat protein